MNTRKCCLIISLLVVLAVSGCASGSASKEDPLSGTWKGEWGPSPERQTEVTVELKWDGKALAGTINPGPRGIEITRGSFDSGTNAITMELESKSPGGEIDHYSIQGKVDGKKMSGTWTRNNGKGDFHITKE